MIDLNDVIRQLTANAAAIRALVEPVSGEQAGWKPDPGTWSMTEVMAHVYNEERLDFRKHLKEYFNDPPLGWGGSEPEPWLQVKDCKQALAGFLAEREASIAWLRGIAMPDWDQSAEAKFGPQEEVYVLKAGDVLVSWVEHDFLHLRQMIELHYAWAEQQARPYSVQYAGGW